MRDFLVEQARLRFSLGRHDCALIVADWVERVTGRDPAKNYRGKYGNGKTIGALAMLRLFDRLAFDAGMIRTDAPQLGDVALVIPPDGKPRGAIFTGSSFVTVAEHGLFGIRTDAQLVAAWTFP